MEQITKKRALDIFGEVDNKIFFAGSIPKITIEKAEDIINRSIDNGAIKAITERNTPQRIAEKHSNYIMWNTESRLYTNKIECYLQYLPDDMAMIVVRSEEGYFTMFYIIA